MSTNISFEVKMLRFDEDYVPSANTRLTTNFANLARGEHRQENLRNVLRMIDNRFNALASWDNPQADRYAIELDIVSVDMKTAFGGTAETFPLIEILNTSIIDNVTGLRIPGMTGNNFSSYVRDYDFSVLLLEHNRDSTEFQVPDRFGDLHGNLFKAFVQSPAYREKFGKLPVICLSVSSNRTYHRTGNHHPILGAEYEQREFSLTDQYFGKMGMKVRYFMPEGSSAPLSFYFFGDLLADYSSLELISTISTMESFQKVYRPEIYNANSPAAACYRPSLGHQDYSTTRIIYDREERSRLAIEQGRFTEETFIRPHRDILEQWSARFPA
ncbi:DUF1852 domain-containing protein [Gluconobacter kanchanaburiensis]|uniref:DUF1852 domain-containing protein n=1 Tax=Gluconobacter kanchanaburiensis NBRC 103587 TaxID=1307948 RepID=A0A511B6B4_9PROT|nr:DUF1852 domain-containing protein [Gluconobacter kanchanaburiensis]MBF0861592.1 DUF1852 family protein [Gluconobacter kanchanaburiensis]GBR67039.1 hypothetical protein AA103587_0082 [Gluconobacter kanchanaburiensis NBRC 103587]GEK95233.1 hypothetical protein GKA01_04300 [Gluconobacter kanchanaburiensis NBRC 103587]